jgi:LPS sulfotransferase NodH
MIDQPFTSFVMLGSMRSGSNLLESYLNQYERLVCHGELFQKTFIGSLGRTEFLGIDLPTRDKHPQRLLDAVRAASPDKITGFRLFQEHNRQAMNAVLQDRLCAKIILTRDPIESFVSLQIARKTKQWMVSDIAHRKAAQIHFDLEEYAAYLSERTAFYAMVAHNLESTGQPFFEIDYSLLNEVENINRLAAFIGDPDAKTWLEQPIKKQNPGALSSKISNIDEVRAALDSPSLHEVQPPDLSSRLESDSDISRTYFCQNLALAFGPQPAVPDFGVRHWLALHNTDMPENWYAARQCFEWKARNPGALFFTVVGHPAKRAYTAFMTKIFNTAQGGYTAIRKDLEREYGLILPQGEISAAHDRSSLELAGYGVDEHRISFKLFLLFVAANLRGETDIRQDGKWQLQTEVIRRYRITHPDVIVIKEENLETGFRYLENRMDLAPASNWENTPDPFYSFALREVYDSEIEALARKAFGPDYAQFGYGDLA